MFAGGSMNIYVYSDESGVFDYVHNDLFVFGGIVCFGTDSKEKWSHLYSAAEKRLRASKMAPRDYELKATQITNSEKMKLFRSLNACYKFGVVVHQQRILREIFSDKKTKQRYLDYAYKIAIKRFFTSTISASIINPNDVENIYFFVDAHSTATNGLYELRESLEKEFKVGTFNYKYDKFFEPIFPTLNTLNVDFCDSKQKLLVRAADIVANRIFYLAKSGNGFSSIRNACIINLP